MDKQGIPAAVPWFPKRGGHMRHFGFALDLEDDPAAVEKYRRYHQNVWPEVEEGLKKVGITVMRIYLIGRRMFMYMETVDDFEPRRDFPKYLETNPRCREWDELMQTFQKRIPEASEGELWALMDEVYVLEA
jgi:L-rhamnose mutarotase